jgi:hypothetical protein
MWLLAPLTLGVGTYLLWRTSQRWPRELSEQGMLLRDGSFVRWQDLRRILVVERRFDDTVLRIELFFRGGQLVLPVANFENGQDAAYMIRAAYREAKNRAAVTLDRSGGIAVQDW